MKKLILLFCLVAQVGFCQVSAGPVLRGQAPNGTFIPASLDAAGQVKVVVDSSTPVNTTNHNPSGTATDPILIQSSDTTPLRMHPGGLGGSPTISTFTWLSNSVPKPVSDFASPAINRFVVIYPWNKIHRGPVGTSNANMQNMMPMNASEPQYFTFASSTYDFSIVADTAAAATVSLEFWPVK